MTLDPALLSWADKQFSQGPPSNQSALRPANLTTLAPSGGAPIDRGAPVL
jgi:hypothetical protein